MLWGGGTAAASEAERPPKVLERSPKPILDVTDLLADFRNLERKSDPEDDALSTAHSRLPARGRRAAVAEAPISPSPRGVQRGGLWGKRGNR